MVLVRLECPTQKYAWGKLGSASAVALLSSSNETIDESLPYAELWMGTHVNGPAKVVSDNGDTKLLSEFIKEDLSVISQDEAVQKKFSDGSLPYLFKVLSVNTALSIQAHPDKKLAEKLHAERPQVYKDPNHKPEMACAVTPFEALCGFLPIKDVVANIESTPELQQLLNESPESKAILQEKEKLTSTDENVQRDTLKVLFSSLMNSDPEKVKTQVAALKSRLEGLDKIEMPNELALRLCSQYPGDVGIFCCYFMCYRLLKEGQSVFLGANEPHAYLSGDCCEIMACSDNVVRAGLTPKLRDVSNLCSMLTYRQPSHSGAEFHPGNLVEAKVNGMSKIYSPPDPNVTEFQMERVVLSKADGDFSLVPSSFASIILILSGSGTAEGTAKSDAKRSKTSFALKRGTVLFQGASSSVTIKSDSDEDLVVFRSSLKHAF